MGDPISMSWSGFGPFDSEEEAQQAADEMQAYHEATSPNKQVSHGSAANNSKS